VCVCVCVCVCEIITDWKDEEIKGKESKFQEMKTLLFADDQVIMPD